jgi:hypothetical protein
LYHAFHTVGSPVASLLVEAVLLLFPSTLVGGERFHALEYG